MQPEVKAIIDNNASDRGKLTRELHLLAKRMLEKSFVAEALRVLYFETI